MIQTAPVRYDAFRMAGGLDLVTPTLAINPSVARSAQNFEISVTGGYTRIAGYERFDGRTSPSTAVFAQITLSSVAGLAVGNTIVNAGATASGVVVAISGTNIYYTKAVGSFSVGQTVLVGATTIGTVQTTTIYVTDAATQATYTAAAADVYRADIGVVPGSGPVRGVVYYNNAVYAWRNNVGGTAMAIYKSSSTGWQAVALGFELPFTAGASTGIVAGDTVYGAVSGATGVVSRVVLENGTTWVGGSGRLILSSVSGTFQTSEGLRPHAGAGPDHATSAGTATAITLAPNGRVQTVEGTFGSNVATRVYGCDGVNRGFEFDGTVFVPIKTGMTNDKPANVSLHKNFLFFSFGASVQNSGVGTPYVWSPIFGANEIVLPEPVTGLLTLPGSVSSGSLAIFSRNNTYILYGTGTATWNLVPFNAGVGAAAYTAQTMEDAYHLDDRGVTKVQTTLSYGNFDASTLTMAIRPFIQARRNLATASGLNREKSQYRLFYSDGYGLYITVVNGKVQGSMPVLFPDPVFCWCDGESANGSEVSYYGGNQGYVYKMDAGTSFDGASIEAFFTLNYGAQGSSRVYKRYRRASLEITGSGYASFYFGYSLAYGTTAVDQQSGSTYNQYTTSFSQATWDNFTWDAFVWDGVTLSPSEVECVGTGENIALTVTSNSKINQPFTVNSAVLHYSVRRGIR